MFVEYKTGGLVVWVAVQYSTLLTFVTAWYPSDLHYFSLSLLCSPS